MAVQVIRKRVLYQASDVVEDLRAFDAPKMKNIGFINEFQGGKMTYV